MNGNTLNLIRASQVKHHRLKHGNDMHVKPDNGMHGKSDNDIYVEHCNDMHVKPDNDMHAEPGNDARTRFQGLHRPIKSDPSYTKNPVRNMRTGFSESKGVSE